MRPLRLLAAAGWFVVGALTVAAVLRTAAPERSRWLVLLAALTPLLYSPAWLVALGAAVSRRWRLLVIACVLVGLHVWWSAPLILGGRGPMSHPTSGARVVALNLNADRATGAATARLIRELRPDVVVLSEVSPVSVAGLGDQPLPVVASDVRPGTDGWMVLSRWPAIDHRVVAVDARTMPRLVLQRPDGGQLVVWQVHPVAPVVGHVAQWRHQLELVRRAVAADRHSPSPVVVAGDFNATRDLPSFHAFLDDGWCDVADGHGLLSTWGAGGRLPPLLRLDHVLVSPDVGVRDVHRTRSFGSDHLGMLADLQFRT